MAKMESNENLVGRLVSGDRRALARVISRLEREEPGVRQIVAGLYPRAGNATTVGFTGPPGVGKSSVIARLIGLYRSENRRVGVVSVDPSSPFSRGAILGDRIRLQEHFLDPGVFVRSMGSRGHLGGLAAHSRLVGMAMEAAGYDVVLFETVGVGQGEVEVAGAAETVVLCLQPGTGDAVQVLKAGIMEIADVYCINKADHPRANAAAAEVRAMLGIGQELEPSPWSPPIVMTRADNGEGIEELKRATEEHRAYLDRSGEGERRRQASLREFVVSWARGRLEREMHQRLNGGERDLLQRVYDRELDPVSAAEKLLEG
jgi:LAO/AO transport system kinase